MAAVGTVSLSAFYPQGLSGLARPLAAIFRPRPAPPSATRATRATFSMSTGQPPVPAVPLVPLPTDAAKASHDQILQAAAEWFMEFGCAATTIDAVAQRLGATKGRSYHHYRSKADLYFDV